MSEEPLEGGCDLIWRPEVQPRDADLKETSLLERHRWEQPPNVSGTQEGQEAE